MKAIVMVNNYQPINPLVGQGWYFLSDSAVSNTGKPFYHPDSYGKLMVSLSGLVRISRLGKCIEPKFAGRYYSEYAPCVHFTLPQYGERLKELSLPLDASRSFDRSLFVGDFISKEYPETLKLKVNGEKKSEFSFENLHLSIEQCISSVSQLNTLKMGDYILPALSGFIEIKEDDYLEVIKGDERVFHVKVK